MRNVYEIRQRPSRMYSWTVPSQVLMFWTYTTIAQAVAAMVPSAEIAALLFSFLFSFVLTLGQRYWGLLVNALAQSASSSSTAHSRRRWGVVLPPPAACIVALTSSDSKQVSSHSTNSSRRQEFEVVRRLGTGSYAVVYLVQEVLFRPAPSEDGHMSTIGFMEFSDDGTFVRNPETVYGCNFAIKYLSKANLDKDALAARMSKVTIHQSLHLHTGIVTLHHTLETPSFLLLLLDLFFTNTPNAQSSFQPPSLKATIPHPSPPHIIHVRPDV
ncbi:hypothetical protein K443DRAFT_655140 [Laccaria amethystina LaAM-08-1]|uniref:Protein kinase domain-containing protein n=1 Tax=Laccaria amethystina LaAM-08-1 TaxID=1095629 RepID=A0A0C9XDY3_9AGAR|nr:hypothetical protein K443DRAFT_655140 [Laccaria amethystina LaAM-08-1]